MVEQYGPAICDEPQRCTNLLRELCDQYRREANVLVTALLARVPAKLREQHDYLPYPGLRARLIGRLADDYSVDRDAAAWAVDAWAFALGVLPATATPVPRRAPRRRGRALAALGLLVAACVAALFLTPVRTIVFSRPVQPYHAVLSATRTHGPVGDVRLALLDARSQKPITTITPGRAVRLRLSWRIQNPRRKARETVTWRIAWHTQTLLSQRASDTAARGRWSWDYLLTIDRTWPPGGGYAAAGSVGVDGHTATTRLSFAVAARRLVGSGRVRGAPARRAGAHPAR